MHIFFQLRLVENALCEIIHFDYNVISTTMFVIANSFDGIALIIDYCWFSIGVYDLVKGINFMSICFKIF